MMNSPFHRPLQVERRGLPHLMVANMDAALATERADKLKDMLQEAAKKIYAEAAVRTAHAQPNVQEPTGEPRPSGSGPRGKAVDAEFHEPKQP